jgi:hypothetical protein
LGLVSGADDFDFRHRVLAHRHQSETRAGLILAHAVDCDADVVDAISVEIGGEAPVRYLGVGRDRDPGYQREKTGQVAASNLDVVDLIGGNKITALGAGRLDRAALRSDRHRLVRVADLQVDIASRARLRCR